MVEFIPSGNKLDLCVVTRAFVVANRAFRLSDGPPAQSYLWSQPPGGINVSFSDFVCGFKGEEYSETTSIEHDGFLQASIE